MCLKHQWNMRIMSYLTSGSLNNYSNLCDLKTDVVITSSNQNSGFNFAAVFL